MNSTTLHIFGAFIAILSLLSCDSWLGVNITSKSQIQKVKSRINDYVDSEMLVNQMQFTYADQRSQSVMGSTTITCGYPHEAKHKTIIVDLSTWKVLKEKEISKPIEGGIHIVDYDFSIIPSLCEKAIKQIKEYDLEYAGIEYFTIRFKEDSDPDYEFTIDGKPKNSPLTSKGRFSGIYYHEVYFTSISGGDLNMRINKELKVKRGGF